MPKLSENFDGQCPKDLDPGPDLIAYARLRAPIYEVVFCDDRFFDLVDREMVSSRRQANGCCSSKRPLAARHRAPAGR